MTEDQQRVEHFKDQLRQVMQERDDFARQLAQVSQERDEAYELLNLLMDRKRLLALAQKGAWVFHTKGTEAEGHGFPYRFESCEHPDCRSVQTDAAREFFETSPLFPNEPGLEPCRRCAANVARAEHAEAHGAALRAAVEQLIERWSVAATNMKANALDTVVESLIAQRADAFRDCAHELRALLTAPPQTEPQP